MSFKKLFKQTDLSSKALSAVITNPLISSDNIRTACIVSLLLPAPVFQKLTDFKIGQESLLLSVKAFLSEALNWSRRCCDAGIGQCEGSAIERYTNNQLLSWNSFLQPVANCIVLLMWKWHFILNLRWPMNAAAAIHCYRAAFYRKLTWLCGIV